MTITASTTLEATNSTVARADSRPPAVTIADQVRDLIVRADPASPIAARDLPGSSPLLIQRSLILSVWDGAAPDLGVKANMTCVLDQFLVTLDDEGHSDLVGTGKAAVRFVKDSSTVQSWHLRKNTLMAAYSALRTLGAYPGPSPVAGMRPKGKKADRTKGGTADKGRPTSDTNVKGNTKKGKAGRGKASASGATRRPRNRVATSDEVLLARVCAQLDSTGALHRRAAALAIACAGAATGEGAQVCWIHHNPAGSGEPALLELAGRHHYNPASGWHIKRRLAALDPWSATAMDNWRAEASSADRPLAQEWSIVYDGTKALTHQSAKNSYDHHINLTLDAADLFWIPGLTAMSIGEWAAAHAALHHPDGLNAAASVMGVDPLNCLRRLTKASTRAYKPL